MGIQRMQEFYASHSMTSNPGTLASMLDGLPTDIEELRDVIGGFSYTLVQPPYSSVNPSQLIVALGN